MTAWIKILHEEKRKQSRPGPRVSAVDDPKQ
jgi:hypothetical protein